MSELKTGRSFGLNFDHKEDFFQTLSDFCRDNDVRQGYIPMFLAAFAETELAGTCDRVDDPEAPVRTPVYLEKVEAVGCGTFSYDPDRKTIVPHIHVTVGLKQLSAAAYSSHLISATVQYLTEMLIIEVTGPEMRRPVHTELYDVPLLTFES
ncbi:DNA-binding protein [Streptomyces sp. N2-109]|uniref:DNA-binding protein n=1 Tax=Streptomyces gossypii TaxID=2883101 RepID=A0ABT2JMP3_9ACTN|nr:PPC domain-containing DNA-binding protein [Streptomyces gossypii]MCT2589157.1 DNA-binding protein [Streptomyces gossypii]